MNPLEFDTLTFFQSVQGAIATREVEKKYLLGVRRVFRFLNTQDEKEDRILNRSAFRCLVRHRRRSNIAVEAWKALLTHYFLDFPLYEGVMKKGRQTMKCST